MGNKTPRHKEEQPNEERTDMYHPDPSTDAVQGRIKARENDFTVTIDLIDNASSFDSRTKRHIYAVSGKGEKIDLTNLLKHSHWSSATFGLSRDFIGGYLIIEFITKNQVHYDSIKEVSNKATIPLEFSIIQKKTHRATYSVIADSATDANQYTTTFYGFHKDVKIDAKLQFVLECEFKSDPFEKYLIVDDEIEIEKLQPYLDTHASYNTAKLQMINQKKLNQYVVLTVPELPQIRAVYWMEQGDQNPRCVIVEHVQDQYFTLWNHIQSSSETNKKAWKSLRRFIESQTVEGGLGLSESFWGYKEMSVVPANINDIPKDDAHVSDRLKLRTSSGRGVLKSSAEYMDIFYAAKTGSMQYLRNYVLKDKVNVNKKDEHGNLPVYYAALCGQSLALTFLFDNGAELDLSSIEGQRTWLAAHSMRIRDILRARSKYSDVGGHQVILQKAYKGTVSEIQSTLNSGQVNVNFVGSGGLRAIDYACLAENAPVIEFLKKNESFDTLISGFRSMAQSGDHHDIIINIGGQRIKTHRILLLSACSYFPEIIGVSNEEFKKPIAVGTNNNNNNNNSNENAQKGPIEFTVTQPIVPLDAYALRAFVHYLCYGAIDWFSNKQVLDQLAVLAKKYTHEEMEILAKYCKAEKITVPKIAMPGHFGKSLLPYVNNAEFHDLVFEINGKQIYAHKVILSARSQYFAAMFSSDMVEAKQYVLPITDEISVEVFLLVLEFIYTDQISDAANLSPMSCLEMILLAHKYMLTALKAFLDDFICSNFDIELEDALDSYTFAVEFKVDRFKKKCAQFIKANIRVIEQSPSYKELSREAQKKIYDEIVNTNYGDPSYLYRHRLRSLPTAHQSNDNARSS